ncbi:MAG TPA: extracellular solute-binding protein [Candidatus Limiplasma sp.]|nr:extracellular solute-binding protein [Candidatus Limiplasma sp.]
MKAPKFVAILLATLMMLTSAWSVALADSEPVELEFYSLKPETVSVMEEIIADFMALNPDIKITLTSVSDSGTVLLTRIATNEMPDILNVYPAEDKYKAMFDDGLMLDLTDEAFMSNVSDTMLDMSAYNGRQYALPMTLSSYGIYIRTDIFEELGIAEPATYADLLAACKTLYDNGYDAFALPNKDVGNVAQRLERTIGVLNHDSDEEFQKIASGEMNVEDSATIRGFAQMCLDIAQYSTPDSLGLDYESAVADIVNGKAAMMFSGTWMLSTMQAANPDIAVKLIPIPSPLSDELSVPVNIDTSFAVSSSCKYPEQALKFIEYLSTTEVAQKYYELDGNVNMIKGVTYDKAQHMYMKELMDEGKMFLTQVNFWPTGLREEMRAPGQQLYVDGDIDEFVQAFGAAIMKLYNQ